MRQIFHDVIRYNVINFNKCNWLLNILIVTKIKQANRRDVPGQTIQIKSIPSYIYNIIKTNTTKLIKNIHPISGNITYISKNITNTNTTITSGKLTIHIKLYSILDILKKNELKNVISPDVFEIYSNSGLDVRRTSSLMKSDTFINGDYIIDIILSGNSSTEYETIS